VYLLARRVGRWPTALATAAFLWSLASVQFHAFDARYYACWFASVVWFAWLIGRPRSRATSISLALAALLLCSSYLLGIVTWFLVCMGALAADDGPWPSRMRRLSPALVGPAIVMPLLALMLRAQVAGAPGASWTEPFTTGRTADFLKELWFPWQLAVAVVVPAVAAAVGRTLPDMQGRARLLAPVLMLLLLPCVLIAMSVVGPPLSMARYAFPAVVGLAAAATIALARCGRAGALACASIWLVLSTLTLHRAVGFQEGVAAQSAALVSDVRDAIARGDRVVFESLQQYAQLDMYAPDLRTRVMLLDAESADVLPDAALVERIEVRLFEQHLARRTSANLGRPVLTRLADWRRGDRVWLVARRTDEPLIWRGLRLLSTRRQLRLVERIAQ
jgi:hypothetical protein